MSQLRQLVKYALGKIVPENLLLVKCSHAANKILLTFDDGPSPEHTPKILDALDLYNSKATFFVVGKKAQAYPDLIREIVSRGHDLGGHTFSHPKRYGITREQWNRELLATDSVLRSILGHTSRLFRPPFGKLRVLDLMDLWLNGRSIVIWNRDPKDSKGASAAEIKLWFQREQFVSGDIVLLHDTCAITADILPEILQLLQSRHLESIGCANAINRSWIAS